MRFDIVTLFPGIFPGYLQQSILSKAIERGIVSVHLHDLRDWTHDKHRSVDDRPYGGGPGMVIRVEPVVECVEEIQARGDEPGRLILLSPQGKRLDQRLVSDLATASRLVLICGRYEGFDQRVIDILQPEEISIGDYVLNGGEVAAMVIIDSVLRLIPGVLGDERSSREDSFSQEHGMLECAQYTRPRVYRGREVPPILLTGDHERIARWRQEDSYRRTRAKRRDLLPDPERPPEDNSTT